MGWDETAMFLVWPSGDAVGRELLLRVGAGRVSKKSCVRLKDISTLVPSGISFLPKQDRRLAGFCHHVTAGDKAVRIGDFKMRFK